MSEAVKTMIYVGAALCVVAIAFLTRPQNASSIPTGIPDSLNVVEDPTSATRMSIVQFDEENFKLDDFEVAKVDGLWVIPSHENYPADAEDQMGAATACVLNLEVLGEADPERDASRHKEFGVREPDQKKLKPGDKGVGTRVTMKDSDDKTLVDLIIGKEVSGQPGQRYVREVGRDAVYLVELDPSKLSTKFDDWIEEDLLKINPQDIGQIDLKDYTVEVQTVPGPRGFELRIGLDQRSEMDFDYDAANSKWDLVKFKLFDPKAGEKGEFVDAKLGEDQELDQAKLNDLRNALDELTIVDVSRKPESMSDELKASADIMKDEESLQSLMRRGFFPNPETLAEGNLEILSKEGETICQMNDGVEYVLRFGSIADTQSGAAAKPGEESQPSGASVSRYLFVMARYNPDVIEKPELIEPPALPEGATDPEGEGTPEDNSKEKEDSEAEASAKKDETATEEDAKPSDEGGSEGGEEKKETPTDNQASFELSLEGTSEVSLNSDQEEGAAAAADEKGDAAQESDTGKAKEEAQAKEETESTEEEAGSAEGSAKSNGKDKTDAKEAPGEAGEAESKSDAKEEMAEEAPKEKTLDEILLERKSIAFENQRRQDEYNAKVKSAKDRVRELNSRFGDWYFEIPDSVYQKIHLNKSQVIKKKGDPAKEVAAPAGAAGFGDLNKLRQALPGAR